MKQKSLIIFVTLAALMFTGFAYADEIVLSAELSGSKFNPGDTVGVSGNLTGVFAPVNVTVTILNGTDFVNISSFNVSTVDADVNFTGVYDLTGAELGEYIANVTYGDLFVELMFEVEAEEDENDKVPEEITEGDGEGLANAIERAELYLERVRGMLESFVDEYDQTLYTDLWNKLEQLRGMLDTAEKYLTDATIALDEGDIKTAARDHAAARNIMGRVKGILNSVVKEHKVQKAEKFMEQFERRITSTQDKIDQLSARLGTANTESVDTKLGNAWGKLKKLQGTVNVSNVDEVLQSLLNSTEQVDEDLEGLGDEEAVSFIKNMNRFEAKVRVLEKSAEKLQRKGGNGEEFAAQLGESNQRMAQLRIQMGEMNFEGLDEAIGEVKDGLKDLRKSSQANTGKSTGNNGKAVGKNKNKAVKP